MSKPRRVDVPPVPPRPVGRPRVYTEPRRLLGLRLPEPLRNRVDRAAARMGVTVTEYVTRLLDRHVPR